MRDRAYNLMMLAGLLALTIIASLWLAGCTPIEQTDDTIARLRDDLNRYQQVVATLPADSPERKTAEKVIPQLQQKLDATERFVEAARTGDDSAILQAAKESGIPWASTAAALILLVMREFRLRQARQELNTTAEALRQVVQSVDKALPVKTEQQKATFDAVQDTATRQIVAKLRVV